MDLDPNVTETAERAARRAGWNLSDLAWGYLERVGAQDSPDLVFYHALAVLHSPAYARENAGALQQDWPRIPLPEDADALRSSAALGRRAATLLDVEADAPGVASGDVPEALRRVAEFDWRGEGRFPQGEDLALSGRWGYLQGSVVMAGAEEDKTIWHESPQGRVVDVRVNERASWTGIPEPVWNYTLGGYRVLKKWLSYRDRAVLGRALRGDEIETFSQIARRIAALLALGEALDASYRSVTALAAPPSSRLPAAEDDPG